MHATAVDKLLEHWALVSVHRAGEKRSVGVSPMSMSNADAVSATYVANSATAINDAAKAAAIIIVLPLPRR